MMKNLRQTASSDLSLPPHSYIYTLRPVSSNIAAISSDDSLRVFDPNTLNVIPDGVLTGVNRSVTCLELSDRQVVTAGRDGCIRWWDLRTSRTSQELKTPKGEGLSALQCHPGSNVVAAGTELEGNGPGDAPIFIWSGMAMHPSIHHTDTRKPDAPRLQLTDSHTDTITELQFDPTHPQTLLSASTDGLVNIFDVSQSNEDDALRQVLNHRSAVHHAGFFTIDVAAVFVLGTDETLSMYQLQSDDESVREAEPVHFGDVREGLGCEYVSGLAGAGPNLYLAAGNHRSPRMDLVPLVRSHRDTMGTDMAGEPISRTFGCQSRLRLPGGHGEEIIRDVYIDTPSEATYTCGEDGMVRAWKLEDGQADADHSVKSTKSSKASRRKETRYKPY